MSYYEWRPYVPVAERRRQAAKQAGEAQEEGAIGLAGDDRGPHDRQELLGQGLVQQPRALQRLCEPPAARPDLCPQRLRGRPADRQGRGSRRWSAAPSSTRSRSASRRSRRAAGRRSAGIARAPSIRWSSCCRARFAKGVMDRVCREGDGLFPAPGGDQAVLQLSGLGRHVQACRGGALWRGRPARRAAAASVRAARRRRKRIARRCRAGSLADETAPASAQVLDDGDVAALFGLEMAEPAKADAAIAASAAKVTAMPTRGKARMKTKAAAGSKQAAATKVNISEALPRKSVAKPPAPSARLPRARSTPLPLLAAIDGDTYDAALTCHRACGLRRCKSGR